MKTTIRKYSSLEKYSVQTNGDNVSSIIDKMIRLTAKYTESYASDIYYDIHNLHSHVKNKENFDIILFFRENGVHSCRTDELDNRYESILFNFTPIQTWRLKYDAESKNTIFARIDIRTNI